MMQDDILRRTTVQQLVAGKGKLVEVPYNASVGDTLNTMLVHNIVAVVVAAPPRQWIGAGGSMILESDKLTGSARKHYIGIVSALDVLIHMAEGGADMDALSLLSTNVATIIGHSLEGLSLWALGPETSVLEAMDPMSKGVHRVLVPLQSQIMEHRSGLETEEASPGYRMLTQTDVVQFLRVAEAASLHPILSQTVEASGAMHSEVFGVSQSMTLIDTMKCMTKVGLRAVAVLDASAMEEQTQLLPAKGRRIVGTFSASDLRGCSAEAFQCWAKEGVLRFLKRAKAARNRGSLIPPFLQHQQQDSLMSAGNGVDTDEVQQLPLVTCTVNTPLEQVISAALEWRVHRVWVVEQQDILVGLISLSNILSVVRDQYASLGLVCN